MLCRASFQFASELLLLSLVVAPNPSGASNLPWAPHTAESKHLSRRHGNQAAGKKGPWDDFAEKKPIRVRKMSDDEGEMFWPDYWGFEPIRRASWEVTLDQKHETSRSLGHLVDKDILEDSTNASIRQPLQAPFALHTDGNLNAQPLRSRLLKSPRDIFPLGPRAFSCPGDTTACTSINRPNSCCPNGSTCQSITDSGQGDVGCCGEGQTCGGQVASCPSGDTSCPGSAGGGCCVPGYTCAGVGCVVSSTAITTVQPVVTASPPSSSPKPPSTTEAAAPIIPASIPSTSNTDAATSISTFTAVTSVISTATASSTHPSSTATPTPTSTTANPTTTSSASAILPVRPTSSAIPTITTTAPPTTVTASQCPTGFYQCSAYDHAGCCRVGRDCGLTSCPAASSTLALNSNGVTVNVIPSGSGDAALSAGGCAVGWFNCAAGQGGGCCPSGYACGTSCTATAVVVQGGQTGTATVAKNNEAGRMEMGWWMMILGAVSLVLLQR